MLPPPTAAAAATRGTTTFCITQIAPAPVPHTAPASPSPAPPLVSPAPSPTASLAQFWGTLHGQKVLASSSFVGHATQHGKVRIGCIQQTLKHGQSHGVNVADSYLQAERNKPKREMKWSAYIKAGLESAK